MTGYTLYNKESKRVLTHPKVGTWYTMSKQEADEALLDLFDHLRLIGMEHLKENFIVMKLDEVT